MTQEPLMEEFEKLRLPKLGGTSEALSRFPKATRASRAGGKAKNAFRNATSTRAKSPTGGRIGGKPKTEYTPEQEGNRTSMRLITGSLGMTAGLPVGAAIGQQHGKRKYPESREFGKARVPRITTLGTAGERAENFRAMHPALTRMPGKKSFAAGVVGGAGLSYGSAMSEQKAKARIVRSRRKTDNMVGKRDPFGVEKALNATPQERHKALWYNKDLTRKGPYNKDQRKVAAHIMGREQMKGQLKGFAAGGALGAGAGAAIGATRGKAKLGALVGGASGAWTGQMRGDYVGRVKGQRKYKQALGKSMTLSAFGVDHGEFSKARKDRPRSSGNPSVGRAATAALVGPLHGAVAGRRGKKLRSLGNEFVGQQVGGTLGGAAGSLLTRGRPAGAIAGSTFGAAGGTVAGAARANRKGYLKPEYQG